MVYRRVAVLPSAYLPALNIFGVLGFGICKVIVCACLFGGCIIFTVDIIHEIIGVNNAEIFGKAFICAALARSAVFI